MRTDRHAGWLRRGAPAWRRGFLLALALLAVGCRQDMHDQPKYEALEASPLFANGMASRPLVEGTVPRGHLRQDRRFYQGVEEGGELVSEVPLPLDRALLERGRSRYEAFCSPCHDRAGNGRGMVVRRGFKQPASFHEPRLQAAAVGYFYSVISNGFGQMSSYAPLLKPADRWAVAAYVKALQLSQALPRELLSADDLAALAAAREAATEATE